MADVLAETCPCACPTSCSNPFSRVVVSYIVAGGTTVHWELKPTFTDPMPYSFQLQYGQAKNNDADDWVDVGAAVTDAYVAVDGEQRFFGKMRNQYYRIQLTTALGVYYSEPVATEGVLDWQDWLRARELTRKEVLRMQQFAGQQGYLLKRRVTGTRCTSCLDYQTQEVKNPYCPYCYGTGFLCGYFWPISCVWADMSPKAYHTNISAPRGTTQDIVVKARMLNTYLLNEEDVFVVQKTDDRYYVHAVQHLAEVRGVPLVAAVELRLAPGSDPVYTIDIPDQLSRLGF